MGLKRPGAQQIPIIYILSNGRSGSTLLDLLLGAHPSIWTLGEAQVLPWDLRRKDAPCGCGVLLSDCPFWSPLVPDMAIEQGTIPLHYFRESPGGGKALRPKEIISLVSGMTDRSRDLAIAEYGSLNARLFALVSQAAEASRNGSITWLVDASKDPYRLAWLHRSGKFDIRVIHLMKDPRAFVYSSTKPVSSGRRSGSGRMIGRWVITNALYSYLCWRLFEPAQVVRLRYEELAGQPQHTLARLGSWLGLTFPADLVDNFRDRPNHAISGNAMRWQHSRITLDERWRTELSSASARTIKVIAWPLARLYGYR